MSISVVIPSYNQAEYIADAIESAYDQTELPKEIIIVDDGSTDNSLEIARHYEHKEFPMIESPVRVISQVNKGLPSARNTGIMNATGDYILFLDADDLLRENAIERIRFYIQQTNADIVAPSFSTFGLQNQEVTLSSQITIQNFAQANYIGYFSAFRRSKLLEIGGYSPKMKWGYEDWHMTLNLLLRGASLVTLTEHLVQYRLKENSMIHVAQQHHNELLAQMIHDFPQLYAQT